MTWLRRLDEPCRLTIRPDSYPGSPCPSCGHTDLVHPHPKWNPELEACAICLILQHVPLSEQRRKS